MEKFKHVFIITGEASGDEHAAKLINELHAEKNSSIQVTGIGGQKMQQAGANVLYPLAKYGVTGITEVVKQWCHIRRAYRLAQDFIKNNKIDLLILVDYPGFNLRFAKWAKQQNITILYYISPQIWAWKANRIKTIQSTIDTMAVILPFEKAIYKKANIPCYFVGHPLSEHIASPLTVEQHKTRLHISPKKQIIGLLPGSRTHEVKQLFPTMLSVAKRINQKFPNLYQFIVPVASSLSHSLFQPDIDQHNDLDLKLIEHSESLDVIRCCDTMIVASGTASLQAAMLQIPSVIIYRTSRLTYLIGTQVIQCAYLGLANLIAQEMIMPELIQDDLSINNLHDELESILIDDSYQLILRNKLKNLCNMLENNAIDCKLAQLVFDILNNRQTSIKDTSKSKQISQIEAKKTRYQTATPVQSPSVTQSSDVSE